MAKCSILCNLYLESHHSVLLGCLVKIGFKCLGTQNGGVKYNKGIQPKILQ